MKKKITINSLNKLYNNKIPITMLTAYDYPTANWVENSDVDICLVGDSLGMVTLGYPDTTIVTMEEMIHHSKAVRRGIKTKFMVVDLPFGSYEMNPKLGLKNSIRLAKECQTEAVKLEGGLEQSEVIKTIVKAGINVIGHIGLTPQKYHSLGGYKVQGKTSAKVNNIDYIIKAMKLVDDALSLQESGAFCVVIEAVPEYIASAITEILDIPTIGIGSGSRVSGQVLVLNDMLGITNDSIPKFCKKYANFIQTATKSISGYCEEVKKHEFPSLDYSYSIEPADLDEFISILKQKYNLNLLVNP